MYRYVYVCVCIYIFICVCVRYVCICIYIRYVKPASVAYYDGSYSYVRGVSVYESKNVCVCYAIYIHVAHYSGRLVIVSGGVG